MTRFFSRSARSRLRPISQHAKAVRALWDAAERLEEAACHFESAGDLNQARWASVTGRQLRLWAKEEENGSHETA